MDDSLGRLQNRLHWPLPTAWWHYRRPDRWNHWSFWAVGRVRENKVLWHQQHRPNVIREYARRSGIVSVMMQYSLLDRRPEEKCFTHFKKQQHQCNGPRALAQGCLAGKEAKDYLGLSMEEVKSVREKLTIFSHPKAIPKGNRICTAQTTL